jgi:hypothetical protein
MRIQWYGLRKLRAQCSNTCIPGDVSSVNCCGKIPIKKLAFNTVVKDSPIRIRDVSCGGRTKATKKKYNVKPGE